MKTNSQRKALTASYIHELRVQLQEAGQDVPQYPVEIQQFLDPQGYNPDDAIAAVVSDAVGLFASSDLSEAAERITALQNSISDLASWHPNYDAESGEIVEEEL